MGKTRVITSPAHQVLEGSRRSSVHAGDDILYVDPESLPVCFGSVADMFAVFLHQVPYREVTFVISRPFVVNEVHEGPTQVHVVETFEL